jgi:hypothetical protein
MAASGWKQLLSGRPWFRGPGTYPLGAYSEFVPPPRLGLRPYGATDLVPFAQKDPFGWNVTEYEDDYELRPGMEEIAGQLIRALVKLDKGQPVRGLSQKVLADNPYWPPELAKRAGSRAHERYVTLLPLALSRTQDDKGRLRWTLFGNSEQGPARGFWKSFYTAPGKELPEEQALKFLRSLLVTAYGESIHDLDDLRAAGFRILPDEDKPILPIWREGPLPRWTEKYRYSRGRGNVRYLLTFKPFSRLPAPVRQAYLDGDLHLLPFPGSLVFWGIAAYRRLYEGLPLGLQVPLLHVLNRQEDPHGIRVPQAGWFDLAVPGTDKHPGHSPDGDERETYKRSHRFARIHRHEDEVAVVAREESILKVLFSTDPQDMGLYGKPMARNAQLWTEDFRGLLDGPLADVDDLATVIEALAEGGTFGYRFQFPPMRVGRYELYWQRPLVAYLSRKTKEPAVVSVAPMGYVTGYRADKPALDRPVELWPRLLQREPHLAALEIFDHAHNFHHFRTSLNVRKILNTRQIFGPKPLPRAFARQLLTLNKSETLEDWLQALPAKASDPDRGKRLMEDVERCLEPATPHGHAPSKPAKSLTYEATARRSFEVEYWKTIVQLAEGEFVNKVNSDCISDPITCKMLTHHQRDLEALGDYLLEYYREKARDAGMGNKVVIGDLPFKWKTDFDFSWSAGWVNNQEGRGEERDLVIVIPGRDRKRAVIMADHYDTAYMADYYDPDYGGSFARLAAAGADDNHSATAALMLAAPIFFELSKAGKLDCDIWLVHLTGEEFPSDCLGARHLTQCLVEGHLKLRLPRGKEKDLSRVAIQGVYVLDMIAHNNDKDLDVYQISPGAGPESMWLAYQAHLATQLWNASLPAWNQRAARRGKTRSQRSFDPKTIPDVAPHLHLYGEVRPSYDPRSTLYNTDGQIFSDAGIPVVLFMENYDIHREGYHDSHDTMENIDLDYGAALAAITIETVARAATEKPGVF